MHVLIDTHVWVWSTLNTSRLSESARLHIVHADKLFISSVSVYEIAQKIRRDVWPGMNLNILDEMINDQNNDIVIIPTTSSIMRNAGLLAWGNRDPFDRIIAATAIINDLKLVTKDHLFRDISEISTIW